jgi:uncharacterized membrane protein YdjX (TVP38/TMEM64 family)
MIVPVQKPLVEFLEWTRHHRLSGALVLILAYILACLLLIPGSLLTLGAGFALGLPLGFVAVFLGSNLGATAVFLLGRTLARDWIACKVAASPRFRAVDRAVSAQGFKVVLLLRLSPAIPFNVLNYALGLTQIPWRAYLLATLLGMVPGTLLYVYVGSAAGAVAELLAHPTERGPAERVLWYLGLAATIVVTLWITWIARRALAATVPADESPPQAAAAP